MSREFWAIYVAAGGEILRYGEGQPGAAEILPLAPEESLWTSDSVRVTAATHYIDGAGFAVAYNPVQSALKANRPTQRRAHWDNATMAWVDERSLDELKSSRWVEMLQARYAEEFGSFTWAGDMFDADERSQVRIQGAVLLAVLSNQAGTTFSIDWTLADNSVRTLSGADMIAVGKAMSTHVAGAHAKARTKRAAIFAANSVAAVNAIVWIDSLPEPL